MIWLARRAKAGIGMLSFGRAVKACYGILCLGTAGRARNAEDWKVKAWLVRLGEALFGVACRGKVRLSR